MPFQFKSGSTAEFNDTNAGARLEELLSQAVRATTTRTTMSGIGASARSWKNTARAPSGSAVAQYTITKGIALTVLILAPLLVVSVGSFGAVPLAAAIIAITGFATKKLFAIATHAADVNKILTLMDSGADHDDDLVIDWDRIKPSLSGGSAAATVAMADRMIIKLVGDITKLDKEVETYINETMKGQAKTSLRPPKSIVLAMLLKAEMDAQTDKQVADAKSAGTAVGWTRGKSNVGIAVKLEPLSAKSKTIVGQQNKVLHRLRRIRFYLRWLYDYTSELEASAYDATAITRETERVIMGAAFLQVHAGGNHGDCKKHCFGPSDADATPPTPPTPTASSTPTAQLKSVLPSNALATRTASGPMKGPEAEIVSKKEKFVNKASDKLVEKYINPHVEAAVSDAIGRVAGSVVGDWSGGLVTDAIGAAVGQAQQSFNVNRPLQNRVQILQKKLREGKFGGELDAEIAKLAAKNDMRAVIRALVKAQSHYHKRIEERVKKLRTVLDAINSAAKAAPKKSPFANCSDAGDAVRYMLKVQHVSEKQMIHVLFVKYALEAMDRQVFREAYKRVNESAINEIASRFSNPLGGLKPTETRLPQQDLVLLIGAAKRNLNHVSTNKGDPLAAQRHFHAVLKDAMGLAAVLQRSYVNLGAFRNEGFKNGIQVVGLDGAVISLKEYQVVSNIRFRPRSKSTQVVDAALDQYEKTTNPTLGRYVEIARSRAVFDRIVKDTENRTRALAALRRECDGWLTGKAENATSARRPAVAQLKHCVEVEQIALEGIVEVFKQLSKDGYELGMIT